MNEELVKEQLKAIKKVSEETKSKSAAKKFLVRAGLLNDSKKVLVAVEK